MLRRALRLAVVSLALAVPATADAGRVGLAEVLTPDGTMIGAAGTGAYSYPADGSIVRIGSARSTPGGVEVRDVTLFNGRVFVDRIQVPARGLVGAHVDGLVADGKAYRVAPNTVVPMSGGSYLVALQEAVSPGRNGSGLVGLRAYVADASLGLAPGTQILIGLGDALQNYGALLLAFLLGLGVLAYRLLQGEKARAAAERVLLVMATARNAPD